MSREGQLGRGRVGLMVALIVVGVAVFLAVKIIPVRINAYNFRDEMREECRMGAVRNSDEVVAGRLMDIAEDLEIPLKRKNLEVHRSRSRMVIRASYDQPIDLKVTTYVYKFREKAEAPLF